MVGGSRKPITRTWFVVAGLFLLFALGTVNHRTAAVSDRTAAVAAASAQTAAQTKGLTVQLQVVFDNFKRVFAARRAERTAQLVQIRRTATTNHKQALALGRISLARAGDNARALAAEGALLDANRGLISGLARQAREISALQARDRHRSMTVARKICTSVELLKRAIRQSVEQTDKTLGQPGTAGFAYYQALPDELAKAHAQNRATLAKFKATRCPA